MYDYYSLISSFIYTQRLVVTILQSGDPHFLQTFHEEQVRGLCRFTVSSLLVNLIQDTLTMISGCGFVQLDPCLLLVSWQCTSYILFTMFAVHSVLDKLIIGSCIVENTSYVIPSIPQECI